MVEFGGEDYIVVVGSAALDVKAIVGEAAAPSANLPGRIRIDVGGVARNIAECLARLEVPTTLITAVGSDPLSDYLLAHTADAGVDVTHSFRVAAGRSNAFIALFDPDGQRVAVADMSTAPYVTSELLWSHHSLIANARAVVIDNSLDVDTLETLIDICTSHKVSICADPTSIYLAPRLIPYISSISLLTPNQREAAVLCDREVSDIDQAVQAAHQLVRAGVRMALITMGDMGAVYATANEYGHVQAPNVDVVDLTGGSDAMTATVVYALINDFPADEAVRLAVTAAALTITTRDTVRSDLSLELLYDQMLV